MGPRSRTPTPTPPPGTILTRLRRATAEGVPVDGYFHWSVRASGQVVELSHCNQPPWGSANPSSDRGP